MGWVYQVLIYTRKHGVKIVSEHTCLLPGHGSLILDDSTVIFVEPLEIKAKTKGWGISMQDIYRIVPVCSLITGQDAPLQTSLTLTLDIGRNWMPSVDISDSFRSNGSHHPKWARVGENKSTRHHTIAQRTKLHSTLLKHSLLQGYPWDTKGDRNPGLLGRHLKGSLNFYKIQV